MTTTYPSDAALKKLWTSVDDTMYQLFKQARIELEASSSLLRALDYYQLDPTNSWEALLDWAMFKDKLATFNSIP